MRWSYPTFHITSLFLLSVGQVVAIAWSGFQYSPVLDEVGHLPAGVYNWEYGKFDVYRVNPPLVRMVAAIPTVLSSAEYDWNGYTNGLTARPEWSLGRGIIKVNPDDWMWYFVAARWMLMPFMLLGGYICYRWSKELYGKTSGSIALTLWCFSPNILAWGATITPDASAAAMGVLAGYCFWNWLRKFTWQQTFIAGLTLGLAELTKTTWIVLFGLWPALWFAWLWINREESRSIPRGVQFKQLVTILIMGLYVLNLGYGFEGSFKRMKSYQFVSRTLAGTDSIVDGGSGGNLFSQSWLGNIPVPVPQDYLTGIDLQKIDFERGMPSYLNGEWKENGWWYYYIEALLLKVPLGTLLLLLFAFGMSCWKRSENWFDWKNEIVLLAPAIVVFVLVSSQTGFSIYFRYILPCFPFVFIWISKVGLLLERKHNVYAVSVVVALTWSVGSSLWVYPHSMSYFNELAGGPTGGHRYLIDANIDWGQDIFYLKKWYDKHPEARPMHVACHTFVDLKHYEIESIPPPRGINQTTDLSLLSQNVLKQMGPHPGWHALSIHKLHNQDGSYEYFLQHFEPVHIVGYSIYIYHITLDEANRVRRGLDLPEIEE